MIRCLFDFDDTRIVSCKISAINGWALSSSLILNNPSISGGSGHLSPTYSMYSLTAFWKSTVIFDQELELFIRRISADVRLLVILSPACSTVVRSCIATMDL